MGSVRALEIRPGDVLAGRYRVESELGRGGMGVVLSVRHIALDTRMALKVMRPDVAAEPEAARRFLREARAAARIESEHVVRVFDVGTLDSGQPYMAMEHLEGMDLGRRLAERGTIQPSEAVAFLLQAIDALAEAHSLGIVHRDLKPSNLFVVHRRDGTEELKVLDFGAAKIVKRSTPAELSGTTHSQLVGTPQYMSPEQLRARPDLDARTDIWSLGVILFQLVGGTLPFQGESFPELCANIIAGRPAELPEALGELEPVLQRCLAKARDARYANVRELEEALLPAAPESVRRARASKSVRPARVQDPLPRTSEPALEMPSTLLQSFDSGVTSLGGTATASVERREPSRARRVALAVVGIGLLSASLMLALRWRTLAPASERAAPSTLAALQPTDAPVTSPAKSAAVAPVIVLREKPDAEPSAELPRRSIAPRRPRATPATPVVSASAAAPTPESSSFPRSAMGGRL